MSHRNEPARERRRQALKQQLSLRSIPLVEPPAEKYNLENHFGWKVLQKCKIGDGSFPPYLLHCVYCDKPDVPSREDGDHDKVMYVLYIRGKDGDLESGDVKETQTAFSSTTVVAPPEPKKQYRRSIESPHRRRVISDFYYIPVQERVSLRYGDDSRGDSGNLVETKKGKNKPPKGARGRTAPKSWQLRAGAETPDESEERARRTTVAALSSEPETEEDEDETYNTFLNNLKNYDCAILKKCDCTEWFGRSPPDAELMESPLEKNRYLYLPRERYHKRPASATKKCTIPSDHHPDSTN